MGSESLTYTGEQLLSRGTKGLQSGEAERDIFKDMGHASGYMHVSLTLMNRWDPLRAVLTRQRDPHNSENYCVRSRGGCQLAEPNEINGAYYHFQTYYLHPEVFTLLRRLGMRPYIVRTQQQ